MDPYNPSNSPGPPQPSRTAGAQSERHSVPPGPAQWPPAPPPPAVPASGVPLTSSGPLPPPISPGGYQQPAPEPAPSLPPALARQSPAVQPPALTQPSAATPAPPDQGTAPALPASTPPVPAPPQPQQQVRTAAARQDPSAMQPMQSMQPIRQTPPPPRRQAPQTLFAHRAGPEEDEGWILGMFRGLGARTVAGSRTLGHLTGALSMALVGIPLFFLACTALLLILVSALSGANADDFFLRWAIWVVMILVLIVCVVGIWMLTTSVLTNSSAATEQWDIARHGRRSVSQSQAQGQPNKYTQRPPTGQPPDVIYPPAALMPAGMPGPGDQPPEGGDNAGAQQQRGRRQLQPQVVPFQQLAPAQFDEKEPDDSSDYYPHKLELGLPSGAPGKGWAIVGSSRRGFSHEHEGKYREDGMAFDIVDGWHLVAVADGGGAYTLARVGANVAVLAALDAMKAQIESNKTSNSRFGLGSKARTRLMPREIARRTILAGFQDAYDAVQAVADKRHESVKQLRATLLLLAHKQEPSGTHVLAGGQIGDGIIVGRNAQGELKWLGQPDTGPTGNEVLFLQDVDPAEWPGRVIVDESWSGPGCHFLVMTDGVADDFLPIDENLERLEKPLFASVLAGKPPAEAAGALTELLGYQRAASFDDRTLVCVYELSGKQ